MMTIVIFPFAARVLHQNCLLWPCLETGLYKSVCLAFVLMFAASKNFAATLTELQVPPGTCILETLPPSQVVILIKQRGKKKVFL